MAPPLSARERPFIIDAPLQIDPKKEFDETELTEFAGVSHQSVRRHIDKLVEFGVVAETAGGKRYHYNLEISVGQLVGEYSGVGHSACSLCRSVGSVSVDGSIGIRGEPQSSLEDHRTS